jgi:hypothetical protein
VANPRVDAVVVAVPPMLRHSGGGMPGEQAPTR